MRNNRDEFDLFLIKNFDKYDRPLFENEFKMIFKDHDILKLPVFHIEYLWELLKN